MLHQSLTADAASVSGGEVPLGQASEHSPLFLENGLQHSEEVVEEVLDRRGTVEGDVVVGPLLVEEARYGADVLEAVGEHLVLTDHRAVFSARAGEASGAMRRLQALIDWAHAET